MRVQSEMTLRKKELYWITVIFNITHTVMCGRLLHAVDFNAVSLTVERDEKRLTSCCLYIT